MTGTRHWEQFREAWGRISDAEYRFRNSETSYKNGKNTGLAMALTELKSAFRHTHVASNNGNTCALCGLDLRNDIHKKET